MSSIDTPIQTPVAKTASLKRLAIYGSLWTVGGQLGANAMRLVGNLVLTRLLFPEAFGLMVLVGVFTAGLQMFSDLGINQNIIHADRGDDPDFLRTAWTLAVIRGGVLWIISCLMTWPYALLYHEPRLLTLLPTISFCAVINGFQSTKLATLNRHLAMGRFNLVQLGSQLASLIVTVGWALLWPSVWALVAGGVALNLARTLLSHWVLQGHRDGFGWDKHAARVMYHFGKWIFISTILTFCARQADKILLGRLISRPMLGVYGIALIWALVPAELLQRVAQQVAFPVFSKLKASPRGLTQAEAARVRRPLSVLGGVIVTCLILGGGNLIACLYDPRYLPAGAMLQLLAVGIWFQMLGNSYAPALLALGKTRQLACGHLAKFMGLLLAVPLGFHLGQIHGVLWGLAASELLKYLVLAGALHPLHLTQWRDDFGFTLMIGIAAGLSSLLTHYPPLQNIPSLGINLGLVVLIWAPMGLPMWRLIKHKAHTQTPQTPQT